jgi:mono/diheme cytochrome c family protein
VASAAIMLPASMSRSLLYSALAAVAAIALAGCGEKGIELAENDPLYDGAKIFNDRCAGCHTFDFAGAEGGAIRANSREYKDGPNFNQRKEQYDAVLYAIRNGGFSSGPMPQNIVVGKQAELVACFVSKYSGRDATRVPDPTGKTIPDAKSGSCEQELASK